MNSGMIAVGIGIQTSCGPKPSAPETTVSTPVTSCDDLSGLGETDLKAREGFAYVKESPLKESRCNNCNLWLPPKGEAPCGGCLLFKGPVFSEGYCTYWAPQV